ncbi:OmpA family protein [Actinomyces viscosus]|uniref:Outer membrane porin F n=2 Tax=Actinomyces viscosus TaxID=1656 RepID=A0A3S4Z8W4_ACTVI|nr:OmpA family protein [Actinomyces viscosus]TFH52602.1 OmpA family protein [Actinomyces viscosus]VEI16246.1 Outer membrane porin F precursor [Actinomyces viscosus]
MPSFTPPSTDRRAQLTRRSVLSLPALVGAGVVLAGCGMLRKSGSASGKGAGSATSARAAATSTGSQSGVMLETEYEGIALNVEVGPVVVKGKQSVVRLGVVMNSEAPESSSSPMLSQALSEDGFYSLRGVLMMSLENGVVFSDLNKSSDGVLDGIGKEKQVEMFAVFAAPDDSIKNVEILLPNLGVVTGVPVVGADEVSYSVADALSNAEMAQESSGPFKLEGLRVAADGSSDTKQDEKSTTVAVAGDVTFATDSDQLSAQADSVLASVVEQIKKYPSGGDLTITGHTDDVADDAHNQDLSERRAKAVAERLKTLTDLSKWKQSVSGKGESAPRVPNDSEENKQANRRVEITLTPSKPAEAGASPSASEAPSSTALPEATGPVGKGPEGVDVTMGGKTARLSMSGVTRVGKFLIGTLLFSEGYSGVGVGVEG